MTVAGLWTLQKGLFDKLAVITDLQPLLGNPPRIHDVPPATPVFPLLLIGNMVPIDFGARDMAGYEVLIWLHAFADNNRGSGVIKQINDALRAALHDQPLPVAAGTVIQCRYENSEEDTLSDNGLLWHGGICFRVFYQI